MSQHTSLAEEPGRAFEVKLRNASRELATQEPIYNFRGGQMEPFFTKQGATREQGVAPTHAAHDHTARVRREFLSDLRTVSQQQAQSLDLYTHGRCHTALPEPEHPPLTQHML
jgi:GTPase SAR1 family protein